MNYEARYRLCISTPIGLKLRTPALASTTLTKWGQVQFTTSTEYALEYIVYPIKWQNSNCGSV